MRSASDRYVLSEIEAALQHDRMCSGPSKHVFKLLFEPMMRFHVAFGDIENDAIPIVEDAIFSARQIFA